MSKLSVICSSFFVAGDLDLAFAANDCSRTGHNGPGDNQARRRRSAQLLLTPLLRYEIAVHSLGRYGHF